MCAAVLGIGLVTKAQAGSTDWVSGDAFHDAIAPFHEQWLEPADLAVRMRNGRPEYNSTWDKGQGGFSFNIYPTSSRAQAENLIGGPSRLWLHNFARAVGGANEYYLLYLVDEEQSGLRCIQRPAK